MGHTILWLLTAVLISGNAAADPLRYRPQPERARAWVLDAHGVSVEESGKPRRAVALPGWQWVGEPYACAPDIAIGPHGEAVISSNVLPVLWKIDPATLAVSVHPLQLDADADKDVGFSALTYSERHAAYFAVSELTGSLWRIDPLLRRAQKIALSQPVYGACAVSMPRSERTGRITRLCLHGKTESLLLNLAPDQRSAYVQTAGCASDAFALTGGER